MARLPPIPPQAQTPAQKQRHEVMDQLRESLGNSFVAKDKSGALVGPFASFLYAPSAIAEPLITMAYAIVNNCVITLRERQLSVLATCSVFHAQFMTYAHIKIGKEVGLSSEQAYDARTGKTPQGLSEEETVAYDFSLALASATGPVKDEIWEKTKNCIGKEKVTALVHVVGLYTYTSMVMNADDVPVSDGEKIES